MKLYLSSYRIGDRADELRVLGSGRTMGFVPNALDFAQPFMQERSNARSLEEVRAAGLDVEPFDLGEYFGRPDDLRSALDALDGVWVRGGNAFVLRQAMRLSGFDAWIGDVGERDFLYGGYSAGVCVLGPSLDGLQHVDDPDVRPYPDSDVIWEGLGVLEYLVLPHYRSDHPESEQIELEVEYCAARDIPFKALRDGEVIVLEGTPPFG